MFTCLIIEALAIETGVDLNLIRGILSTHGLRQMIEVMCEVPFDEDEARRFRAKTARRIRIVQVGWFLLATLFEKLGGSKLVDDNYFRGFAIVQCLGLPVTASSSFCALACVASILSSVLPGWSWLHGFRWTLYYSIIAIIESAAQAPAQVNNRANGNVPARAAAVAAVAAPLNGVRNYVPYSGRRAFIAPAVHARNAQSIVLRRQSVSLSSAREHNMPAEPGQSDVVGGASAVHADDRFHDDDDDNDNEQEDVDELFSGSIDEEEKRSLPPSALVQPLSF
jgi:hypothetical protein